MRRFLIYFTLIGLPYMVNGQSDIVVTAEYSSVVTVGEQFTVIYNVNAGGGELSVPSFSDFSKLMGPNTSFGQSTQIINGKVTRVVSFSYIYYFQAIREGNFVIPPAVFELKGKEYRSDSLRIQVLPDPSRTASSKNNTVTEDSSLPTSDLFVTLNLNRKEVYVGEPVLASVKIYTRVNLQGINQKQLGYPPFNNFLKTELDTPPLTHLNQESVNGVRYGTGVVKQLILYPQIAGEMTIDPVEVTVLVEQRIGQADPFFGDVFASYQTVPKQVSSRPVTLKVKSLPGTRPADYSGVVGKLSIEASLNQDSVKVNDALNFRVKITGSGNIKLASTPNLKLPADIEAYDPKVTEQLQNGSSGISGSKTFEYLLIPRRHGEFKIPPVSYSYFDTGTGRYETVTTNEFTFYAEKTDTQSDAVAIYSGVAGEDVRYIGKDIRFIRPEPGRLIKPGKILSAGVSFYSIYVIAFVAFITILFLRREHVKRNSDMSVVRNRRAGKVAGKRLRAAAGCLKDKQVDKFYEEILKALWGYLSDKLNIPVAGLTRSNAGNALKNKGVGDEIIANLNAILDTCEYTRYAPSASNAEAEKIYEGASQFISSVENTIR